jgi:3-phenylpropionate/cinnamic acid dioxygenase small subunit
MTSQMHTTDPVQFVLEEGRLLNEARYAEWLSLFAEDGLYWVPLAGDAQKDYLNHASLACEDRYLLATRIKRLNSPRAHSLEPGARSLHVLQTPQLEKSTEDNQEISLQTPFIYTETLGARMTLLAGIWRHRLRATNDGFRIVMKRVDLVNAKAAHEAIQLFP